MLIYDFIVYFFVGGCPPLTLFKHDQQHSTHIIMERISACIESCTPLPVLFSRLLHVCCFPHHTQDIRPEVNDARVHFALNCASMSCPPLRRTLFTGTGLDAELNEVRSQATINSRHNFSHAKPCFERAQSFTPQTHVVRLHQGETNVL